MIRRILLIGVGLIAALIIIGGMAVAAGALDWWAARAVGERFRWQADAQANAPVSPLRRPLLFSAYEPGLSAVTGARRRALDALTANQTIDGLQALLDARRLTSEELVLLMLARIQDEPSTYISLNPDILTLARERDTERAAGQTRGLLHGLPIGIKDDIAVEGLPFTGGAAALNAAFAPRDATLVARLEFAGAIIIGKHNLSEWAGMIATADAPNGWSGAGGQTRHSLGAFDVGGSSSGTAVAVALGQAVAGVGTETIGSLIDPASQNGVVAIKPTVGLISRDGVMPITRAADTPGVIARSVSDAAALLTIMAAEDPADPATTALGSAFGTAYITSLRTDGLQGVRIGVVRPRFEIQPGDNALLDRALAVLRSGGAEVYELTPILADAQNVPDSAAFVYNGFAAQLDAFLQSDAIADAPPSLAAVIDYNLTNPAAAPYGQSGLLAAQAGAQDEAPYMEMAVRVESEAQAWLSARLNANALTMLVTVGETLGGWAAPAGAPSITVPMGALATGELRGLTFIGGRLSESGLIAAAYAYEQAAGIGRALASPFGG